MKYKVLPQDFQVDEIINLENLKKKDEGKGPIYHYFILKKTNYTQFKAFEKISNIFRVQPKFIHFAGTKDKVGTTTQVISLTNIKKSNIQANLDFFNQRLSPDLNITYLGEYNSRVNLGDNLGNKFTITLRDLNQEELNIIEKQLSIIREKGVLNYFDEQRFGFANNSHIIGKYILQNNLELAVKEIVTSLPKEPKEDAKEWVSEIINNWEDIKNQNQKIISQLIKQAPKFYKQEAKLLSHLHNYKNDFPGAMRIQPKKLRTLYVNAYQSYLFNLVLDQLEELPKNLELMNLEIDLSTSYGKIYKEYIEEDSLSIESFALKHMPELIQEKVTRETIIDVQNLKLLVKAKDELHEKKQKAILKFSLQPGAYATNVIKQIFK